MIFFKFSCYTEFKYDKIFYLYFYVTNYFNFNFSEKKQGWLKTQILVRK